MSQQFSTNEFELVAQNWKTTLATIDFKNIESKGVMNYVTNLATVAKPIADCIKQVQDGMRNTGVPTSEVEAELQRLKAADPEYNQIVNEIANLNAQKLVFGQQLATAMQQAGTLVANIQKNTLAIDGLNRSIEHGNAVLNHRALAYLDDMGKRARERLLKYHYYMAKAYEYRQLSPYTGELKLDTLFTEFARIAEAGSGHELNQSDFETLKAVYEEQLSQIAAESLAGITTTRLSRRRHFSLAFRPTNCRSLTKASL